MPVVSGNLFALFLQEKEPTQAWSWFGSLNEFLFNEIVWYDTSDDAN